MVKDAGDKLSTALDVKFKGNKVTVKNSFGKTDRLDFYKVRVTGRSSLSCFLSGLQSNADLAIFDEDLNRLASSRNDDDSSETVQTQLDKGIYFIRVNQISGKSDYNLKFSLSGDAGDRYTKSYKVPPGQLKKGKFVYDDFIGKNGDKFDYYQIKLDGPSNLSLFLNGLEANTQLTLVNAKGKKIAFVTSGSDSSTTLDQLLSGGIYYIKINAKAGFTKYKLKLFFNSSGTDDNSIPTAKPITIGPNTSTFNESVGGTDTQDFYKVNLTSPSSLNLTLNGLSSDADLELQDSTGKVLSSSANPGTAQDLINSNLAAGTYYVRVFPKAGNTTSTSYNLNVTAAPLRAMGLTSDNKLVAFNPDQLDKAVSFAVTGLASGETLSGIDFRPSTGDLFGLSNTNKLYSINLATGAATSVGTVSAVPAGTSFGFDFNPVVDRIRVVSDADANTRLDPATASAITDTTLAYAVGDVNSAANPNVTAAAYTNNFAGTGTTTLYGIDTTLNTLVRQGDLNGSPISPNAGTLSTVGSLGFDFDVSSGFDVVTDGSLVNTAYASSGSTLYTINLTTGAATSLGSVTVNGTATTLVGLAVRA